MSSYLNPYQIAILQEMGICVWQPQTDVINNAQSETANRAAVTTSQDATTSDSRTKPSAAVSGQARIAALRSMLGNKDDSKASKAQSASSSEPVAKSSKPQASSIHSKGDMDEQLATPVVETIDPQRFGQMGQDIMHALSLFHDAKAIQWQYGSELSLKNNVLSLPYQSAPTLAADKRRLWQVISAK